MNSVEEAYKNLASGILWFANGSLWDFGTARSSIWSKSTQTSYARSVGTDLIQDDKFPPFELSLQISAALLYLRDDLVQTTGQRIWGLTFTLYPNGKFNIEYDYNKPEGYEETDETISGDEINESLARLAGKDDASS